MTEMAIGTALQVLEDANFVDADPNHQPTSHIGGIGLAQIDHLMYRGLEASNFQRYNTGKRSDHYMISAQFAPQAAA